MTKCRDDLVSKSIVLEIFSDLYWFDEDSLVVSKKDIDKIYERLRQIGYCEKCKHWESDTHICRFEPHKTREEAIKYLIKPVATSTEIGEEKQKEFEAYNMAIEALSADRPMGEWIFNPKDAIELMFTKPKCSECGFESSDGGNYCPNCGARMGGDTE